MKQISGNILNIEKGVICHQVNCQGVMGAGLALQIKNKWSNVYGQYKDCYDKGFVVLGNALVVSVDPNIYVANLCAQNFYGRKHGVIYTDYDALDSCLKSLATWHQKFNPDLPVYIPYKMSCGLAGGDWEKVVSIIETYIPEAVVMKLGG